MRMKKRISDHRPAVAAQRRQRMQARLVAAAFRLAAQGGVTATTIDGVVTAAGVSRGTFYKYFETPDALLQEVGHAVSDALLQTMRPVVETLEDPAQRISVGARTVLRMVGRYPMLAGFLARSGWPSVAVTPLFDSVVGATLAEGIRRRRFAAMPAELAHSALVGTLLGAIHASTRKKAPPALAELTAEVILRALGLPAKEARAIASMPLPTDAIDFDPIVRKLIAGVPVSPAADPE